MKKRILTGLIAVTVLAVSAFGLTGCGGNGGEAKTGGDGVTLAGSTSVQPLAESMAEVYMESNDVNIEVQGGGSGQGIKSIEEGIADVGMLSREVKDEEKASVGKEFVIAQDGVAVIVNKDVKADDLTLDEIKDIYTGKIKNWKEVGGDDKAISVVTREDGSGTRGAFTEITGVMEDDVDNTTADALVQPSTGAVKETVSTTPDSIGYVSLGSLDDTVKTVKVEGTEATVENVLNKSYKISRPFVFITGEEISESAQAFIDFAMGAEGQKLVEENGFIPVA